MTERPSQMSQDVAYAMNLLAHPMGSLAAASAMGLGMATQAWGLWFGAVAGAMENAGRLATAPAAKADAETVAAVKARAAAKNLMADAQSLAREMAETAPRKAAAKPARPAGKAATAASRAKPAAAAAMKKPASLGKPAKPDDLKAIAGVGPKLEQVLNGMGIWTFGQIAGWTPAEAAWIDEQLGFSGRVLRDDWMGQAKMLTGAAGA